MKSVLLAFAAATGRAIAAIAIASNRKFAMPK